MRSGSPRHGFRVIMPDLRAHGLSGKPHEPSIYPKGILARDLRELIAHLELGRFRSRRLLARRADDRRGRGRGAAGRARRSSAARGSRACAIGSGARPSSSRRSRGSTRVQRGDPHWLSIQFMKSQKVDRVAAALCSTASRMRSWTGSKPSPCRRWCVCGTRTTTTARREELAEALPNAVFEEVPGTHMSSVTKPEFGEAIASFLAA